MSSQLSQSAGKSQAYVERISTSLSAGNKLPIKCVVVSATEASQAASLVKVACIMR